MSTGARLGILAGVIVVAVAALVIASGGSDGDKSTTPTTATSTGTAATTTDAQAKPAGPPPNVVVVKDGKPVGGIKAIKVKKGDQVRLVVKSDVADEIHIHAYNLHKDVDAGGTVSFNFPATIDGGFEIELEERKQQIAELTVEP